MRIGVFTALFAKLSLDEVIKKIKPLGIRTVELGTGNYPGDPHVKLDWLSSPAKLKEFHQKLDDQGISISALSCHGNSLHPNKKTADTHTETSRRTILLAEKLGVNRVRRRLADSDRWYEYPRYLFSNESKDILLLCGETLDQLGVAWRFSRRNAISVARREAVARLDEFVGPKY